MKHLEGILTALGELLGCLEGILGALQAILAENVAWNLHGTCITCIGSAAAGGPSEGRGSIKEFDSRGPDTEAVFYDLKRPHRKVCGGLYTLRGSRRPRACSMELGGFCLSAVRSDLYSASKLVPKLSNMAPKSDPK